MTTADAAEQPQQTLRCNNIEITLLGTAHVSRVSAEAVERLLNSGEFDAVAVELCPSRHNAMLNPDQLAHMDLFQVIKTGKVFTVIASLALGAFQQRLADQFGIEPGAEMRAAVRAAQEQHLPVLLIDREIGVTLKRIYRNVPWWQRLSLFTGLIASVVSREEVDEAQIEQLKDGDILESTFAHFAEEAPNLYVPLIEERDRYMAARLQQVCGDSDYKRVLAVIGAGHLQGIASLLQQGNNTSGQTIAELDAVPPQGRWLKRLPWIIVAIIVTGFVIGFSRSPELGWNLVADWVLINGGLAALGALLAAAHPLTILGAFVAAPLTSLNPAIGAGMVTGAIEIALRKPRVGDFDHLRHDTTQLRGWWRNRVTRVLLVFLFSTIGSAIGTYVAGFRIFDRLAG
jgi:pheromone shutdown-related protein TraB